MASPSQLIVYSAGRIAFNKAAIMAWAYQEGSFAFRMCRNISERRAQLSNWLRKAWAAAKREAAMLMDAARREVETRAYLAQRAKETTYDERRIACLCRKAVSRQKRATWKSW